MKKGEAAGRLDIPTDREINKQLEKRQKEVNSKLQNRTRRNHSLFDTPILARNRGIKTNARNARVSGERIRSYGLKRVMLKLNKENENKKAGWNDIQPKHKKKKK